MLERPIEFNGIRTWSDIVVNTFYSENCREFEATIFTCIKKGKIINFIFLERDPGIIVVSILCWLTARLLLQNRDSACSSSKELKKFPFMWNKQPKRRLRSLFHVLYSTVHITGTQQIITSILLSPPNKTPWIFSICFAAECHFTWNVTKAFHSNSTLLPILPIMQSHHPCGVYGTTSQSLDNCCCCRVF